MIVETKASPAGVEVQEYEREEFLEDVWVYHEGEQLTIIGPTEAGKTTLGYQLLGKTAGPTLPAIVLVMKPRDETVSTFSKSNGFQIIRSWPPVRNPLQQRKVHGWTLWPKHDFDSIERTDNELYRQFRRAIMDSYRKGHRIVFGDELAGLCDELKLTTEVKTVYSRGRSMDTGFWGATQRPVDIPKLAYSSAHHLFLAHDPDESDRKRFKEIGGGIDPELIDKVTLRLPQYWWLYLRRKDRTVCIVRA